MYGRTQVVDRVLEDGESPLSSFLEKAPGNEDEVDLAMMKAIPLPYRIAPTQEQRANADVASWVARATARVVGDFTHILRRMRGPTQAYAANLESRKGGGGRHWLRGEQHHPLALLWSRWRARWRS